MSPSATESARKVLHRNAYGARLKPVALYRVPSRRIDDRIRNLCAKVASSEGNDYEPTISELKAALREHTDRLRKMAVESLAQKAASVKDRRKS